MQASKYYFGSFFFKLAGYFKGQLISKPIYDLLTSPKKRTDEFDLFAFLLFTVQTNQIRPFVFLENLRLANLLFEINWPLVEISANPLHLIDFYQCENWKKKS